ncbi:MAG: iron-sulfur cluster-binding protein [Acidocella sp. 20-57-95]|nr:MAG: iron-sulfur cluster-binding protein [Acidocella sp. 20-57-95]OYV62647.1 MAG: iron-sulfur cluster-binding protein [Acidocella sp. 21-58-7]HQT63534.1 LutB/LldF family L-lactate oxidation iron-sulfur protein [Acidocella sp.]
MSAFQGRVSSALADATLKIAIDRTTNTARTKRAAAIGAWPEFAEARELGRDIKDHVIANLEYYLTQFEANAIKTGAKVHWARTGQEACEIVVGICKAANAKSVTRSKSMLGEEIGLPHALEAAGIERVETDLAEHIIQLAGEKPSHIIWPALHKTREQVGELFRANHTDPGALASVEQMVNSARRNLREKFMAADVGISGANFLIADTGGICTVTNEGNAELTTTPPRVHIVTVGIEKLVPSMTEAMTMLRLLVRSATGAELTQYTTFHTGPKRPGDLDGPEEFHIVLVDAGRTKMLAEGLAEMLRCLRCGACMNHCVVFRQIGGHAYGSTYPGPMGSVITPSQDGIEQFQDLPRACTLNGQCGEVCPVAIPLPKLIRGWRTKAWVQGYEPAISKTALLLWRFLALRPGLYQFASNIALRFMPIFARSGWIAKMPLAGGWTTYRDLPSPQGGTFLSQYKAKHRKAAK